MKKIFLSTLTILLVLTVFGCNKKVEKTQKSTKLEDEDIYASTIEELIKPVDISGFRIDNISLVYENNESIFMASVTNTSNNIINLDSIKAIFTDEENNEYVLVMTVDSPIVSFQTANTVSKTDDDITKCNKVRYEIIYQPETH